jgi:hypothetical protein
MELTKPLKIKEKNQKNYFFTYYPGTTFPFLGSKIFRLQLVSSTTIQKEIKKT